MAQLGHGQVEAALASVVEHHVEGRAHAEELNRTSWSHLEQAGHMWDNLVTPEVLLHVVEVLDQVGVVGHAQLLVQAYAQLGRTGDREACV